MARMHKSEEVFSVGGLAKWLDIDRDTVRSWVEHGKIPHFKIGDYVGFRKDTLLHWFAQLERENPANRAHTIVFTDPLASSTPPAEIYKPTIRLEDDEVHADPHETSASLRTRTIGSDR
jgi:excisionase family DNA binding protein